MSKPSLHSLSSQAYTRQLEARLDALYQSHHQSIVILDLQHHILDFNDLAKQIAMQRFGRLMQKGEDFSHYVQDDRWADFYSSFQEVLQGLPIFKERQIFAADQRSLTYDMQYTPMFNGSGEVTAVCFTMINQEEKRQMQLKLWQEQRFVTSILNTTNAMIMVIDSQGRIVRFNKACENLTGKPGATVIGSCLWETLIPANEQEEVRKIYQELEQQATKMATYTICDQSGSPHRISWSLDQMVGIDGEALIISTGIDITARLHAEQELEKSHAMLQQAQKMEAIGQVAGGIAHDFNNMLTAITGYADLLQPQISSLEGQEDLSELLRASQKAQALTQQLLLLSRKTVSTIQGQSQVEAVLEQARALWQQLLGKKIQLNYDLQAAQAQVALEATQLEQVLMNLVLNARDAIGKVGQIQIQTQIIAQPSHRVPMFGQFAAGDYIRIAVSDSGPGISEEVRKQIFDPFFTTKSHGTGLGLVVVYRLIKEAKGWVEISSDTSGACFTVFLPLSVETSDQVGTLVKAGQTVLLYNLPAQDQQIMTILQKQAYAYHLIDQLAAFQAGQTLITALSCWAEVQRYYQTGQRVLYLASEAELNSDNLEILAPHEDVLIKPYSAYQLLLRLQKMQPSR